MEKATVETAVKKKSFDETMSEFDSKIDDFVESQLPPKDMNARKYLGLSQDDMRALSADECAEASTLLSDLAGTLFLSENKYKARYNYLNELLNKQVYPRCGQYESNGKFKSIEEKKYLAIKEDDYSSKVHADLTKTKVRLDLIAGLFLRMESLSNAYKNLYYTKKGDKNGKAQSW